jgi:hypothetical protein
MGENGETPHWRVDKAAAARGPGTVTTADTTDGTSLVTPASSLQDRMVQLVKPPPSPPSVESTAPPKRTPPRANESHGVGRAVADRDGDDRRAHERVGNPVYGPDTSTDETAASATASASTDAAAPHTDQAEATRDQGRPTKTNASALSASRDHQDAVTTNPPRPSEDPADATGDDERRPDAPTEPPNKPEGMRGQGSRERAETGVFEAARGGERGPGEDGDEECRPGRPDEPPDKPEVEPRGPTGVEVEPGGKTDVEQDERAAHEDADAMADGSAEETHPDVHVEVESVETRRDASIEVERWSASAHIRSTTRVEESGQRTSRDDEDVPGAPSDCHPPSTSPDETARPQNEPPSVELEGESRLVTSCDEECTGGETDASGPPEHDEDARDRPKKLANVSDRISEHLEQEGREDSPWRAQVEPYDPGDEADASGASDGVKDDGNRSKNLRKTLERVSKRSEPKEEESSPSGAPDDPDEPGGETAAPGNLHSTQEGPRAGTSDDVDGTDASCRDRTPEGHLDLEDKSGDVEGDWSRAEVVEGAGYDGKRPRTEENERVGDTNARCRDKWPGGHLGEQDESGDVEGDRERWSDGDSDQRVGRRGWKDGATSGTRRDSKRVETTPLAEDESNQHGERKRRMAHVPEASIPPANHHRRPADHPNPPRRRGRLKQDLEKSVRREREDSLTHFERSRRGRIGQTRSDEDTP